MVGILDLRECVDGCGDGLLGLGMVGPEEIKKSIFYAPDGIQFSKTHDFKDDPWAGGAYRPEVFAQRGLGELPKWGAQRGRAKKQLPFIQRFDCLSSPEKTDYRK